MKSSIGTKKIWKNGVNVLFFAALLLLIFSPSAKAWFLKQLLSVGLFKAEIKKENTDKKPSPINFSYQDENGNTFTSNDLKGKVVFINFWATWCPPCRAEMPSLNKLYQQLKDDNRFIFLFLNEDENFQKVKSFMDTNGYQFPVSIAHGGFPKEIFSGTLPTTVVLDKEGRIVMKHEGMAKYNSSEFIEQLKSLL